MLDIVQPDRLRAFFPAIVLALTSGRAGLVLGGFVVLSAVAGVAQWWRRTWSFDGQVLHLDEGVLVRNERRIPIDRIQHVELERRVRHQALGLAAVRVETAGGGGSELSLEAVPLHEAVALQTLVRTAVERTTPAPSIENGDGMPAPPAPPPLPPTELVALPPARLLLAGITGPEVFAVFVGLGIGLDALTDLGVDIESIGERDLAPAVLVLVGLVGIPTWFLAAGLIALVRRWDLRATVQGTSLRVTYGLLRRQEFVMSTARVRDVRIRERLLLRPFGRADVRVHSAGSGSGDSSRVDIPLLDADEIDRILSHVLPAATPRPPLRPAPPAARVRAVVRHGALGAFLAACVAVVAASGGAGWWVALALALVPAGAAFGIAVHRSLGHARSAGVHHTRSGVIGRTTALVPEARIQSVAVRSSVFQRRRDLATVRLDLAGGSAAVVDRTTADARAIAAAAVAGTTGPGPTLHLIPHP